MSTRTCCLYSASLPERDLNGPFSGRSGRLWERAPGGDDEGEHADDRPGESGGGRHPDGGDLDAGGRRRVPPSPWRHDSRSLIRINDSHVSRSKTGDRGKGRMFFYPAGGNNQPVENQRILPFSPSPVTLLDTWLPLGWAG